MSDPALAGPVTTPTTEDRVLPAVTYGLYFLSLAAGFPLLLGLILAYVMRDKAGQVTRSHYDFLIRTFWIGLAFGLIGGVLLIVGVPLSIILIGLPLVAIGGTILALLGLWFIVRLVLGAVYLARDEAYPRPTAWLF